MGQKTKIEWSAVKNQRGVEVATLGKVRAELSNGCHIFLYDAASGDLLATAHARGPLSGRRMASALLREFKR